MAASVAGSVDARHKEERVKGMNCTSWGISARNLSIWQSLDLQVWTGTRLRASGTRCCPLLAELCLKRTGLRLTEASSV